MANGEPEPTRDATGDSAAQDRRMTMCRLLIAERQIVERQLGLDLCANPYWDILLDIYLARFEARSVYQSCLAPGAAPAKAHRQSTKLMRLGAVDRALDPEDHRRMNITLREETCAALDRIMDLLAATWPPPPPSA